MTAAQREAQSPYHIRLIAADREGVDDLIQQSDELMLTLYPPDICFLDDAAALSQDNVRLLGVLRENNLVGIGAVKFLQHDIAYGEIKRVFITAAHRGRGLAKLLMQQLEALAVAAGLTALRLETGPLQPEAIKLYCSLGFYERGPYAHYRAHPLSIFMEKMLP